MKSNMIITVDVGATKTLVARFDDGLVAAKHRFPTVHDEKLFLQELIETINQLAQTSAIKAISIALPGMINPEGVLLIAPNLGWKNFTIREQLSQHFTCPIYIGNDARLAALSETRVLSSIPPLCLYLTISTGIGAGLTLHGKLQEGLMQTEVGHMLLHYQGKLRQWESFASGRAILETYGKYAYEITSPATWREIANKISLGLLVLIPALQPSTIIIGGSIGTHFTHYQIELVATLHKHLDPLSIPVPTLTQAKHPQEAVIYGCYEYAQATLVA